jgi:hypothetical protein
LQQGVAFAYRPSAILAADRAIVVETLLVA